MAPPCEGGREVKPDSDAAAADAASLSLSVSHRGRLYPAPSTFVPRRSAAVGAVARVTEGPAAEGATPEGLAAVVRPIMGAEEWAGLTGSEFTVPSAVEGLAATGIAVGSMDTADTYVDAGSNLVQSAGTGLRIRRPLHSWATEATTSSGPFPRAAMGLSCSGRGSSARRGVVPMYRLSERYMSCRCRREILPPFSWTHPG